MLKLMIITIVIEIMMMMITIMINCIDTYLPKNLLKSFKDLFYAMTGYQYSNSAISVSRDKIDTWPVIVFRMLAPYGGYVDIEVFPTVTFVLLYLSIYLSITSIYHIYIYLYIHAFVKKNSAIYSQLYAFHIYIWDRYFLCGLGIDRY